jgi:hypothetical protein
MFRFENAAPFFGAGSVIAGNVTDRSPCLSEKVVLEVIETVPPHSAREAIAESPVLDEQGSFSLSVPAWAPATFSAELLPGVRPSVTYCVALVRDRVVRGETVVVIAGRALDPVAPSERAAGPLSAKLPVNEAPARHAGPLVVSVALENATKNVASVAVSVVRRLRYTHVTGMAREDEVWRSPEPILVPPFTFLSTNVGFPAPSTHHSLRSRHIECVFAVRVSCGQYSLELPLSVLSSPSTLAPGTLETWDPNRAKTLISLAPIARHLHPPPSIATELGSAWQEDRVTLNDTRLFFLDVAGTGAVQLAGTWQSGVWHPITTSATTSPASGPPAPPPSSSIAPPAPRVEVHCPVGSVALRLARERVSGLLDGKEVCEWGEEDGPGRVKIAVRDRDGMGVGGRWWLVVIGFSVVPAEFQVRVVSNAPMFSILDDDGL